MIPAVPLVAPAPPRDPLAGEPPPPGRRVALRERGTTFVRELPGPPGAPTVLLLHGWIASAGLNWIHAFAPLARHFRVVAADLRGHGRGIRSPRRFRLEDCADDAAALLAALGTEPVIAVGYSMGGPVAQLLWRRHRGRVAGLVLCATSATPVARRSHRALFGAMMAGAAGLSGRGDARLPRRPERSGGAGETASAAGRPRTFARWALGEMRRHHWPTLAEAGAALAGYDARGWLHRVDVPTAALVTRRDRGVSPAAQHATAAAIRGATVHVLDAGHTACTRPRFGTALAAACDDVAGRLA